MKKDIIERFGGLQKEEPLSCIEDELLLADSCVLESVSPFAGYYTQPNASKPLYLYLMLEGNASFWPVMEAIQQVKKSAPFDFDAVFGEISFTDQTHCYTIRVRDLPHYHLIAELQLLLKNQGLVFRKRNRKLVQIPGLIRLEKFFYLQELGNGFYLDRQQDHHMYFTVNASLAWEQFKKLTEEVKYDVNLLYFDAAQAHFFEDGKTTRLIRIYKEGLTTEKLGEVALRYAKLIPKYQV